MWHVVFSMVLINLTKKKKGGKKSNAKEGSVSEIIQFYNLT